MNFSNIIGHNSITTVSAIIFDGKDSSYHELHSFTAFNKDLYIKMFTTMVNIKYVTILSPPQYMKEDIREKRILYNEEEQKIKIKESNPARLLMNDSATSRRIL